MARQVEEDTEKCAVGWLTVEGRYRGGLSMEPPSMALPWPKYRRWDTPHEIDISRSMMNKILHHEFERN
jgi:hypothetical protein